MDAKFDSDGLPLCPDCGRSLSHAPSDGRDRETMGGYEISYFECETENTKWEVIDKVFEKSIHPA